MREQRPDIITILVEASPNEMLRDYRRRKYFSIFGNILRVAKQYGVDARPTDDGIICSAPKSRMQEFVSKLHFSNVKYKAL